jgi:hypothetical protein
MLFEDDKTLMKACLRYDIRHVLFRKRGLSTEKALLRVKPDVVLCGGDLFLYNT